MYSSGLVPRWLAMFGLVGSPLIIHLRRPSCCSASWSQGGAGQGLATFPEFIWELGLGIYCVVWGFKLASPILGEERPASV